jgi:alkanesulfonate monooxygenase SsuD/methylene tetrahydromethanopterin reductase-like flavin-dependent oxidoreductase (luciferase family)
VPSPTTPERGKTGGMRFGFKTSPQSTTWDDMLAVWRAADEIELFESGWTFDHFEPIFSDRSGPCLEGWLTLTALAQATRRLRVGVLVTGVPYRHPAVLANMAATLDQISHGRLELGLGAGWNTDEANAYGIDLLGIKERMDRFDEAYCEPKAVQQPHPPICIGGSGEKRTLRTVARVAQHWNYVGGPVAEYVRLKGVLAEHCASFGRDPGEIMTSAHLRYDADDPEGLVTEAEAFAEAGLDLGIVYLPPPHSPADLETIADLVAGI